MLGRELFLDIPRSLMVDKAAHNVLHETAIHLERKLDLQGCVRW